MGRSAARIAETVRRESAPVLRSGFAFGPMNALGIVSESSTRTSAHKPPFIRRSASTKCTNRSRSMPRRRASSTRSPRSTCARIRSSTRCSTSANSRQPLPRRCAGATRVERERFGLHAFTPLHRDETSLSLGLIGRFWRPDLGVLKIADAAAFVRHDDPRDAKLVLRFEVVGRVGCAPAAHRNLRALPDRTHAAAVHAVLARDPDGERLDPAPDADGCRNGAGRASPHLPLRHARATRIETA